MHLTVLKSAIAKSFQQIIHGKRREFSIYHLLIDSPSTLPMMGNLQNKE